MKILAVDLGQSHSVACVYDSMSAKAEFRRIATMPSAVQGLLDEVRPERVVVEIGSVTGWVSDLVQTTGISLQVANTAAPAWRWSNTKRKTDRDDAPRLAQLGLRYNPWIREVYERVQRGSPVRKKQAVIAVARRVIVRCWAMLRDGTSWKATPLTTTSP